MMVANKYIKKRLNYDSFDGRDSSINHKII